MTTTQDILKQESETTLPHFGLADLNNFIATLKEIGNTNYEKVCVLIKLNKRPVFFHAGKFTTNENNIWIRKKENIVDMFDHSSLYEKLLYTNNSEKFYQETGLSPTQFAIVGGGLPIVVKGTGIVGCLIISGLSDVEDHNLGYNSLLAYKKLLLKK